MDLSGGQSGGELTLHVCGTFRVFDAEGKDCTPRGAKTCGLLALLALASHYKCTRIWLQDKLWSDRGKEHGAASLRQCLSEIRRSFGPLKAALYSDRSTVALDQTCVRVIDDPNEGQFLQGIDVTDPEFEDWMTVERSKRSEHELEGIATPNLGRPVTQAQERPPLKLNVYCEGPDDPALRAVEDFIVDSLSCTLREMLIADITSFPSGSKTASNPCDVSIRVRSFTMGDRVIGVRVSAEDGRSGSLIWSDTQQTFLQGVLPTDSTDLLRLGNQMLDALSTHFSIRARNSPGQAASGALVHLALNRLFSMTEEGSIAADQLLESAAEHDPRNGLVFAMRAHLRSIQWAERYEVDEERLREEAQHFWGLAMDREPTNAAVLATLANTSLILDRNFDLSEELAAQAINLNAANPFAWWVKSASQLYLQDYQSAYDSARRASALLGPGPLKFWWDLQMGTTSAMSGAYDEALRDLRRAHALAPTFRPTLRLMVILCARQGDQDGLSKALDKLKALEPDFSTGRLIGDPDYPASLIRSDQFLTDGTRGLLQDFDGSSG